MSDCDNIERLLWDRLQGKLSEKDKNSLEKHLSECAECGRVAETFAALESSKNADRKAVADIDAAQFEDAVFLKIRNREREKRFAHEERGYTIRMYFSMGLAAAIVAFMVLSLGDLDRYIIPTRMALEEPTSQERQYDAVRITLKSDETITTNSAPSFEDLEPPKESAKAVLKIVSPPSIASAPETSISPQSNSEAYFQRPLQMRKKEASPAGLQEALLPEKAEKKQEIIDKGGVMVEEGLPEKEMAAVPMEHANGSMFYQSIEQIEPGKGVPVQGFSILQNPITKPAPDSVAINSMYLMDETSLSMSQQSRAYYPQVIVNSGVVPGIETPRSVLVTVDKLPVPVAVITPEYPVWARKNGISGEVWVKARVDDKGNVEKAQIVSSTMPGYGFEESALEAAKKNKYRPAEANGIKIGIWVIYPVKFVFEKKDS